MDVTSEVKQTIAAELKLPLEQLHDDTKLADLGAESIDLIEIIFALEEKFDIDISVKAGAARQQPGANPTSAASLSDFATIGDVCRAVQALVDAKSAR